MIRVQNLVKKFADFTAVNDISFAVPKGEIFAFLGLIMNFLVLPIFFLSGALYRLDNLPKVLSVFTRVDPLSYGVDGLRGALIGASQFGVVNNLAVLAGIAVVLLIVGAWRFSKIEI